MILAQFVQRWEKQRTITLLSLNQIASILMGWKILENSTMQFMTPPCFKKKFISYTCLYNRFLPTFNQASYFVPALCGYSHGNKQVKQLKD